MPKYGGASTDSPFGASAPSGLLAPSAVPPVPRSWPLPLLNCVFAMAISKELLEILVCPVCKAVVELKPDQSGLKCVQCHRVYPIRDDIPVMLVDEARVEE